MFDFFIDNASTYSLLQGNHNPGLVAVSIGVAIISSIMGLQIAGMARQAQGNLQRQIALVSGSLALGGGIWSMHFIGMLAFEMPAHVHYHPLITLLSMGPSVFASWVALQMLSHSTINARQLICGGILVGSGIGAMHYSGMAAMHMDARLAYDPYWFAASIVVAILMAMLALWVHFGLNKSARFTSNQTTLIAGIIMGCAIASMHYTGMAAARFIGTVGTGPGENSQVFLATIIGATTVAISLLVLAGNLILRYRQLYRQMLENESRLRAIVDTAVDGIITIDGTGTIIAANNATEKLFGWTTEELIGKNIKLLMPNPYHSEHDQYLENFYKTRQKKIIGTGREVTALRKDGTEFPVRLAVGEAKIKGQKLFVGFVSDLTERKAMEKDLVIAKDRAEQAAHAKGMFLANMSHEIRTPMNAIIGFTELLLDSPLQPDQQKHLQTVGRSARSLLKLLNDILDTAKLERGALELDQEVFSLKELCAQIIQELKIQADKKSLELSFIYTATHHDFVFGDALRLRQILVNLLGNAIKFTERGRITLKVAAEGEKVSLKIIDTGIGIAPDRIKQIFTPFTQADASMARRFGGTGLGTTIARQLAELMGGTITATSELGHGSCFEVCLPLAAAVPLKHTTEQQKITLPVLQILIADDVPENLEVLQLMLTRRGHRTITACNGLEAYQRFQEHSFDVVLMDVQMPELDGLQASKMIRQWEQQQGKTPTPIIALTASVLEEDRQNAKAAGMNGFASKPVDLHELQSEISRCLALTPSTLEVAPQQAVTSTEIIDWTSAGERWGDDETLAQAIRRFCIDNQKFVSSLAEKNLQEIHEQAHRIKGAAANLGLSALAEVAHRLEQQHEISIPLLREFESAFSQVIVALKAATQSSMNALPATQSGKYPDIALLQKLEQAYRQSTFDDESYRALANTASPAELAKLDNALDQFDFDTAAAVVRTWIDTCTVVLEEK